jgi:hypothetical protein
MSESTIPTTPDAEIDDLLTADLADVCTDIPLLPKGLYRLKVTKLEETVNETSRKRGIKIALATLDEAQSTRGEPIKPGFPIFDHISLTPTDNYPKESIMKRLKAFRQAVTGDEGGSFYPLEQYAGETVQAMLKVEPAKGEYGESTKVARYGDK